MIKYYVIKDKRQVVAILDGTKWDAYIKICKMMKDTDLGLVPSSKYEMPSRFKVVLNCDPLDEFNEEFGKKRAKKILLDNYYRSLHKRLDKFREAMIVVNSKVFETPDEIKQ